jgi:hypothetical protein
VRRRDCQLQDGAREKRAGRENFWNSVDTLALWVLCYEKRHSRLSAMRNYFTLLSFEISTPNAGHATHHDEHVVPKSCVPSPPRHNTKVGHFFSMMRDFLRSAPTVSEG